MKADSFKQAAAAPQPSQTDPWLLSMTAVYALRGLRPAVVDPIVLSVWGSGMVLSKGSKACICGDQSAGPCVAYAGLMTDVYFLGNLYYRLPWSDRSAHPARHPMQCFASRLLGLVDLWTVCQPVSFDSGLGDSQGYMLGSSQSQLSSS